MTFFHTVCFQVLELWMLYHLTCFYPFTQYFLYLDTFYCVATVTANIGFSIHLGYPLNQ